jgi:hypothetical protein
VGRWLVIGFLALSAGCTSAAPQSAAPPPAAETITLRNPATGMTVTCGPYMIGRLQQQLAPLSSRPYGARQADLMEELRRERESRDRCLGQYVSVGYEIVP